MNMFIIVEIYLKSAGCMKYFFILTKAINLFLAINTANTRFLIFEQLLCMALVIISRTVALNGNIRTECVRNMNGLFDTEIKKIHNERYCFFIEILCLLSHHHYDILLCHLAFYCYRYEIDCR